VVGTYRDLGEDHSWLPPGVELYRVDLTDASAVDQLVATTRPDLVHHLAAQSSVADSWRDPIATWSMNTAMQFYVLEAVRTLGREIRVVVVGSCDEYGSVSEADNPIDESQALAPRNPYALSKVVQDLMGLQYAENAHVPVIRVRPFLQLGPRRSAQFVAGSYARQVAEIAARLRDPVVHVGNVDLERDFTDVRDVARAYTLLGEHGESGEVYNIASGTAHSLRELLTVMLDVAGVTVEIREEPSLKREGEAPRLIGDASKLREATGWTPVLSFEQSAHDTLAWWSRRITATLVSSGEAN